MSDEANNKKLIVGGAIIAVCLLGLVYVIFLRGDPAPTKEQTAAEARAAEIQKAAEEQAAKNPQPAAPELAPANRAGRGMAPAK